jgi:ribosomal protein S18 acetylase RimI-like enzyme
MMLTSVSKISADALDYMASFTFANKPFMNHAFPQCDSKSALIEALKKGGDRWSVLLSAQPLALFTLRTSNATAIVEHFSPESPDVIATAISGLRDHLIKRKVQEIEMNASEDFAEPLSRNGFEKRNTLLRFGVSVVQANIMPILPLSNPTERDIPALAKLMQESYARNREKLVSDHSIETKLHDIMTGIKGTFLPESSFISKAADKVVSACLITSTGTRTANIEAIFTHPLHRARGLATIEITMSMNRLQRKEITVLNVWLEETDEVARRLFEKLGFKKDLRIVQMSLRVR